MKNIHCIQSSALAVLLALFVCLSQISGAKGEEKLADPWLVVSETKSLAVTSKMHWISDEFLVYALDKTKVCCVNPMGGNEWEWSPGEGFTVEEVHYLQKDLWVVCQKDDESLHYVWLNTVNGKLKGGCEAATLVELGTAMNIEKPLRFRPMGRGYVWTEWQVEGSDDSSGSYVCVFRFQGKRKPKLTNHYPIEEAWHSLRELSMDGKYVVDLGVEGCLRIREIRKGKIVSSNGEPDPVDQGIPRDEDEDEEEISTMCGVAYNGKNMLYFARSGKGNDRSLLIVMKSGSGAYAQRTMLAPGDVAMSVSEKGIASLGSIGKVYVMDKKGKRRVTLDNAVVGQCQALAIAPKGTAIATWDEENTLRVLREKN